ncbi:MAG: hypothetical protein NWE89_01435 [Candidatus Bathyarchaeota archaeon]|nr:hypothetical protein [Candidatus Bathyarchaeota archaeon]
MTIKLIEFGPFGCRIVRGTVESFDDIPCYYNVVKVAVDEDVTVYVDPVKKTMQKEKGINPV